MPLTISIGTNPRKRKLFIWNQNCYCYVWQKEADIANKSGKQMRSISFQGMLDLCTNMPIACNMHWLVVNTNIYKYPNYNSHLLVVRPIFFSFYFGKPLVQVMRILSVSNRCAPFFSGACLILEQICQLQFTLIGALFDILLFSRWQPSGAGNENMICLADDS